MAVNKVEYGGKTLVDLTSDSVTPETLAAGVTAHNKSGEQIVGTFTETDPTVPAWAKAASKPTYSASEVGALPLGGGAMTGAIDVSGTSNVLDFGTTGYFRGSTSSGNKFDFFALVNSTRFIVGGSYPALELKGKNTRPTYNGSNVALQSDIPTRSVVTKPTDQSVVTYFKISNFGTWYGLATNEKVSLLIGTRSGETILFTLAGENATTMGASALRLNDRYSKISGIYYKISENAIYVSLAAWANILSVDVLSDKSGNYTPVVEQITALPVDATGAAADAKLIAVPIIPFGSHYTNGIVVGNTAQNLTFGGKNARPTYNGKEVALVEDIGSTSSGGGMLWLGSLHISSLSNNADVTNKISYKPKLSDVYYDAPQPMAISTADDGSGTGENRVYYYNSMSWDYMNLRLTMYFIATTISGATSKLTLTYTYANDSSTPTKITASLS